MPIMYPCFLRWLHGQILARNRQNLTRETCGRPSAAGRWRNGWRCAASGWKHNRKWCADLLAVMRAAVDTVNPNLTLGFQTVEGAYSGYGMAEIDCIPGREQRPAGDVPPGGGFLYRPPPPGLAGQGSLDGRQVASCPRR